MSQSTQLMFGDATTDELQEQIRLVNTRILEATADLAKPLGQTAWLDLRTEIYNLKLERTRLRDLLYAQV